MMKIRRLNKLLAICGVLKDKPTPGNPSWGTRVYVHTYVCVCMCMVCSALDLGGKWKTLKYGNVSILQFPYSSFHTLVSVLSVSVLCFRTFISALQCFPFTPTWDGSPGETAVSEYVIEDRQVFPWHLSRSYQRTDYIEWASMCALVQVIKNARA